MNKVIIGLVGEIAAGKTAVTDYLKEKHGAVSFRFSDMLRDILKRLHLEEKRANMQTLSTILRQNFSEDIMSKVIARDVEQSDASLIITEGVRRPSDIIFLKQVPGFYLAAVIADERTRFERLTQRSENPDDRKKTYEQFQIDEQQEAEQKIKGMIKEAEFKIDNSGTVEQLHAQIDEIISKLKE